MGYCQQYFPTTCEYLNNGQVRDAHLTCSTITEILQQNLWDSCMVFTVAVAIHSSQVRIFNRHPVFCSHSILGGASYETGFCPHGVSYEVFKQATEAELKPMRTHEGTIGMTVFS